MSLDYEIVEFQDADQWRKWLAKHHADTDGVHIRMYKKASGLASITYDEALDHALCFGWIDGIRKSYDERSYTQKFTPRRKRSIWSKRNVEYIARLTDAGLMMPSGINEVERAKTDGRWDAAYDKPSEMVAPDYFLAALEKRPKAKECFESLNKTNRYAIAWKLHTAKTDTTRMKRQEKFLDMLEAGEKLY